MTAAAPADSRRPAKPRPSLVLPVGVLAFLAITWFSLSREFGIGLEPGRLIEDITRGARIPYREHENPALRGLLQPN